MIYLGTNEMGHDANEIGFPEIHSCQAIVYQTKSMLHGWHDSSGNNPILTAKAILFNSRVQTADMTHATTAECIVGVINANHRFSKEFQSYWKDELLIVADKLGFHGPVLGYRVNSHLASAEKSGQGGGDKMYVRFERTAKGWEVHYKTWSKLKYGAEVDEPADNRMQFKGVTLGEKLYDHLAVIKKDPATKGPLHKVSASAFTRFQ